MRTDLGDSASGRKGPGIREAERLQPGDLRFNWKPGVPNEVQPHKI